MHPDVVRLIPVKVGDTDITTRSVLRLNCPMCGGEREAEVVVMSHRSEMEQGIPFRRDWMPDCALCGKQLRPRSEIGEVCTTGAKVQGEHDEPKHNLMLLPCKEGVCQECATEHNEWEPHNLCLYYQYHFHGLYGRFPTWADAMAHCSDEVKIATIEILKECGVTVSEVGAA